MPDKNCNCISVVLNHQVLFLSFTNWWNMPWWQLLLILSNFVLPHLFSSISSTLRKNGFVLEEDLHASPGNHYLLKAVPFSKNITFGVQGIISFHMLDIFLSCRTWSYFNFPWLDVKELISMLADSQGDCSIISSYKLDKTDSVCPSRVRAMLASRACRMSTMIGDPLTKTEMRKVSTKFS